ncbi:T9SS-dependent M36 family metallopeptidase [Pontibacter sp. JH31]|uniref:T9SS-dependent M36 family metallopeptidase n=1 Tax=Pontibacter aquaedesilientis TaxID=2766980 RepID=A0ABR7XE94_9BACT|nr:T9SS-dependent M36 family metallopeptidase [Pontibacter aquaedesilientis]MBD1396623.1 T9SS-dependent M36 family metallopeptidase [Pontibacter aquaedesilientis]
MKRNLRYVTQLTLLMMLLLGTSLAYGQGKSNPQKKPVPQVALDHIKANKQKFKVNDRDIADLKLSSESRGKKSGVTHLYIIQQHEGIEIHGAITNMAIASDGKVVHIGERLYNGLDGKVNSKQPTLDAAGAIAAAARHLGTAIKEPLTVLEAAHGNNREALLSKGGISLEPIPAKLVYQPMFDGSLRLAWEVSIYELDAQNWWNIRVDANTGELLDKDNMVVHCQFENDGAGGRFLHETHSHTAAAAPLDEDMDMAPYAPMAGPLNNGKAPGVYEVYPMPIESPSHGSRKPMNAAAVVDGMASPTGWHTDDKKSYTITRGNNVYAYEDPNNTGFIVSNSDNGSDVVYGYSPDGGTQRVFKHQFDFSKGPESYKDAAITNLFYWNNIIHDMWYKYGFDEESGNFQASNFGKDGLGNDYVMAEAQDGRNVSTIRNNANFATPIDGRRPRMQMYLWSGVPDPDKFRVTAPASIAGSYPTGTAAFGPALTPTPITGKLVLVNSEGANAVEGCGAVLNAAAVAGNIAVVYRGSCGFAVKVKNAQNAGAIAVVVINNTSGAPGNMGGADATITIPSVMISDVTGASIRALLDANQEVVVMLKDDGSGPEIDGDFDNGIIVHEYGHGISNRLTGGRNTTSCLPTQVLASGQVLTTEQMGEGWSDWFGLMMTMKKGDTREKIRGIGTYAVGQPTNGRGIRPAPYSTDFSVNNYTYGATNNPSLSAPHGIGFVFATILWEMTWDLIDKYGFDPDLYNGNGGNNMAMQLVIDGLKLQPCYPGFVDGRNAILLADQLNNGGANQELIWRAFARRGVGYSASQGLSYYRFDQVEAFDLPASIAAVNVSNVLSPAELGNDKELLLSYPNPFSESTTISFKARESGHTVLKVYDITGREVETLFEGNVKGGETYKHEFKAAGRENGMYIYRIVNGGTTRSGTMLLIK